MTARDMTAADADWWMPHALIAAFGLLVAVILRLVPGWSVPLHAWITLAGLVLAGLVGHAAVRAVTLAVRRRWRDALVALLLAAALGVTATLMMTYGRSHGLTIDDAMIAAPPTTTGGSR